MPIIRKKLLVLVFDGARARFFEHRGGGHLKELFRKSAGLRSHSREVLSDRPGRGHRRAGGSQRHAYESQHDAHKMEKHNFTHELVQVAQRAYERNRYDGLIVVAPKRSLGEFRALSPAKLNRAVRKELAKDLAGLAQRELEVQLADILR